MSELSLGADGAIAGTEEIIGENDPRIIPAFQISAPPWADNTGPRELFSGVPSFFELISSLVGALTDRDPRPSLISSYGNKFMKWPASFGVDGIALHTGAFIHYAWVAQMKRVEEKVTLALHGAPALAFQFAYEDRWRAQARIERGRARVATALAEDVVTLARRVDESEASWRDRLASMSGVGGYRVAPLERARLWSVAGDPYADPSARIGALTLLRAGLTRDEKRTLADLLERTAHPHVRAAIEAAASAPAG
jgi:hypothetical protein